MNKAKSFAKILSLIMALIMLSSVVVLPASAASAPAAPAKIVASTSTTEIKLSWSKVSGATGYRIYYKFPRDLHWKTAVSSTTATSKTWKNLPSGETYIFAVRSYTKTTSGVTWGGYKQVATATKPSAPKKLTASQTTSAIKLNWSEVKGATGYRIYYRTSATANWKIAVSTTDDTEHIFSNLASAKRYIFAVRPYIKTGSGVIWGSYKELETATKPLTTAKLFAENDIHNKTITLSWSAVTRADGYRIYRREYGEEAWKTVVDFTTSTSYTFKNIADGSYEFAVMAVVKTALGNICGYYRSTFLNMFTPTTTVPATTLPTTRPTTTQPTYNHTTYPPEQN